MIGSVVLRKSYMLRFLRILVSTVFDRFEAWGHDEDFRYD